MPRYLSIVRIVRKLHEYLFSYSEVSPLLSGKVLFNELAAGASKIVEGICYILSYVDLPIWVRDLINNLHSPSGYGNRSKICIMIVSNRSKRFVCSLSNSP